MKFVYIIIFLFILNLHTRLYAQDYPDGGLWNTFNAEYALNSRFVVQFTQELRFRENLSRLNLFYTNLGIEYKLSKNIKTAFVYRWIDKYLDDNTFSFRHRLMLDMTYKYKVKNLNLSYRHRLQVEGRDIFTSENGKRKEWYSRSKVTVKYDRGKRYIPYAAIELRYQIQDHRNFESDKTWHRVRWIAGTDYKINNKNIFSFYYLIQNEFNVITPQTLYILGLEYNLSL